MQLQNATSASQVGALTPVSNATGCSPSARPAVASNAAQVASGRSSAETAITMTQPQSGVFHLKSVVRQAYTSAGYSQFI